MNPLERLFPGLIGSDWQVTSNATLEYNCLAWASDVDDDWWWPGDNIDHPAWPHPIPNEETVEYLRRVFDSFGYTEVADETLEAGWEKVAIFAFSDTAPNHAARQLASGQMDLQTRNSRRHRTRPPSARRSGVRSSGSDPEATSRDLNMKPG